jgi:hypothetical protein
MRECLAQSGAGTKSTRFLALCRRAGAFRSTAKPQGSSIEKLTGERLNAKKPLNVSGFSLFPRRHILGGMDPPSIEDLVIASLRLSPASICELCFFLPRIKPLEIRLAVKALRREGQIVQIEGRDDEGRPVYCLAGYLEASGWIDHSDLVLGRNYGGHYYSGDEAE